MRYRTVKEATEFVRALARVKSVGAREFLGVKLDSVPAWEAAGTGPIEHKLDGAEIEAVYLSYREATDQQKEQAKPAKLAGIKLERIVGRLVDVRRCKDKTVQVLFTNGLRDGEGNIAFRGPNIDKGILCYLSVGEGLGESVDEIIARVPQVLIDRLRASKSKSSKTRVIDEAKEPLLPEMAKAAKVSRGAAMIDVPSVEDSKPDKKRVKLV
jgi:hypothetical protein